jgi:hypothetical protein
MELLNLFQLSWQDSELVFALTQQSYQTSTQNVVLQQDQWFQITVTVNSTFVSMFVDGNKKGLIWAGD